MIDKIILVAFGITLFSLIIRIFQKKWHEIIYDFIVIFPFLMILIPAVFKGQFVFLRNFQWIYLFGPVLYIYILGMSGKKMRWVFLLHLLPFIIMTIITFIIGLDTPKFRTLGRFNGFLSLISIGIYTFLIVTYLIKHKKNIKNIYSTLEISQTMKWALYLLGLTILYFLANTTLIIYVELNPENIPPYNLTGIHLLFTSVFLIIFDLFTIHQSTINVNIPGPSAKDNNHIRKYEKSKITIKEMKRIIQKVNSIMDEKKPYINPDFSLDSLAELTGIVRYKISQSLNLGMGKNFYDYVNEFRVNEFKEQIQSTDNSYLTILGIAYNCGFKSKSSFNSVFKKLSGFTPTEYRKSLINKSELIG